MKSIFVVQSARRCFRLIVRLKVGYLLLCVLIAIMIFQALNGLQLRGRTFPTDSQFALGRSALSCGSMLG